MKRIIITDCHDEQHLVEATATFEKIERDGNEGYVTKVISQREVFYTEESIDEIQKRFSEAAEPFEEDAREPEETSKFLILTEKDTSNIAAIINIELVSSVVFNSTYNATITMSNGEKYTVYGTRTEIFSKLGINEINKVPKMMLGTYKKLN